MRGRYIKDIREKECTNLLITKDESSYKKTLRGKSYESKDDKKEDIIQELEKYLESPEDETCEDNYLFSNHKMHLYKDVTCNMNYKPRICCSWTLQDSQSTVDVFTNKKLLKNIHDRKKILTLHCNDVMTTVDKISDLVGYRMVCYYEHAIANIISLNNVKKKYHVTCHQ